MMDNKKKPTGKELSTIKTAPSLAAFNQEVIGNAIRAALPGGNSLSTDQVNGAALAAQSTDLNPFTREIHITNMGVMKAAASDASWANEWLRATGEREPEFVYTTPGQMSVDELKAALNEFRTDCAKFNTVPELVNALYAALDINPSTDVVVLAKMYRFSTREAWTNNVKTALMLGTKEEVRTLYGLSPKPDYQAWGVVRLKEYEPSKNNNSKKSAADGWAEAHAKYAPLDRAKKRARSACYRACVPVTSAQIRRLREGVKATQITVEKRLDTQHDAPQGAGAEGPRWDIVDGTASVVSDSDDNVFDSDPNVIDQADSDSEIDQDDSTDEQEDTEIEKPTYQIPASVQESANQLAQIAEGYQNAGKGVSEAQDKLININLGKLTRKDDELRSAVMKALTGQEHYGDLPPAMRLAILNGWLKLSRPADGSFPQPCDRAAADVNAIKAAMNGKVEPRKQVATPKSLRDYIAANGQTLTILQWKQLNTKAAEIAATFNGITTEAIHGHISPADVTSTVELRTHTEALLTLCELQPA